jgi:hypothetical protein
MSKRYDAVKRELINQFKQRQPIKGQAADVKSTLINSVKHDDGSEEIEFKDNNSKSSLSNSTRKNSSNKDSNKQKAGKQQQAQKSQDPAVEEQMREAWMEALRDPDVKALVPHKEWIDLNAQQRQDWLAAYRKFSKQDHNKSYLLRGVEDYRKQ